MTDGEETTRANPEAKAPARAGGWKLATGLIVGVAALATGLAAFALTRDDDPPPSTMHQVAVAHRACDDWLDRGDGAPGHGPQGARCDDMTSWMADHLPHAAGMMGGSMRWDDPDAMRDACVRAMGEHGTGLDDSTDPDEWCEQMADWMSGHMANGDE